LHQSRRFSAAYAHGVKAGEATLAAREPEKLAAGPHLPEPGADVVLVGNSNVGKSALFNALTGAYVTVSNYPGTTVEVTTGSAVLDGQRTPVTDTPGIASFLPSSEDERVTRDILLVERHRAVILVGDAKNLERTLLLGVQLAEMDLPFVLCLNMMDEAAGRGIAIQAEKLSSRLGVEVVPTVAVRREGIARLVRALAAPRRGAVLVEYPDAIERAIASIEPLLPLAPISSRSLALLVACGDETLHAWLAERMEAADLERLDEIRQKLRREIGADVAYAVNRARLRVARHLANGAASRRGPQVSRRRWVVRLEELTTHPVWGVPILGVALYLAYLFVGKLGAGTLVDFLEDGLFGGVISPAAVAAADRWIPWQFLRDLLVGPYGVVTMALAYSLALLLPIVTTFFIAFGVLEDSGYLPRLAVMVNRLFQKMGLNGKAVLPMVLGLGCDTMATMTTRILETPKERLIVILLLALGVPCSAQLTVVLAMLGGVALWATLVWAAVVGGILVLVGRLASRVLPGRGSDFVLELPPLRLPRIGNIVVKTLARVEWYLKEAVPLFVLGTLLLFFADRLHLLGFVERLARPVVSGWLGLPSQTAEAFVVGFLRRDFGAAGLFRLARAGALDPIQIVVSMVVITLFIPCIANFFMIVKERGWKTAAAIAAFILPFTLAVGGLLNAFLRTVPGPWR
jgi:ferrous iron transport protein B